MDGIRGAGGWAGPDRRGSRALDVLDLSGVRQVHARPRRPASRIRWRRAASYGLVRHPDLFRLGVVRVRRPRHDAHALHLRRDQHRLSGGRDPLRRAQSDGDLRSRTIRRTSGASAGACCLSCTDAMSTPNSKLPTPTNLSRDRVSLEFGVWNLGVVQYHRKRWLKLPNPPLPSELPVVPLARRGRAADDRRTARREPSAVGRSHQPGARGGSDGAAAAPEERRRRAGRRRSAPDRHRRRRQADGQGADRDARARRRRGASRARSSSRTITARSKRS